MKRQCHTVSNPLNYIYSNSEINLYSNIHSSLQKTVSFDSLNNSNRNSPLKIQSKINTFPKNNYNVLMNLNKQEENNHTLKSRLNANNSCLLPNLKIRPSKPKRSFKIPQKFVLLRQEKDRLNDFEILSKRSKLPPVNIINEKRRQEILKSDNEEQILDTARKFNYTVLKNIEMNDALQFEKVHTNKGNLCYKRLINILIIFEQLFYELLK